MPHPETFGDVCDAAAVLGVSQSVEDSPLEVTDFNRFLFGDPVDAVPEKVLGLQKEKMELVAVQRLPAKSFGARRENNELRLSHHPVKFHGGSVGEEIRRAGDQVTRDE